MNMNTVTFWQDSCRSNLGIAANVCIQERGYSPVFTKWLIVSDLVGTYRGGVCFPVHDEAGSIIGCHYRTKDGQWPYAPSGNRARPLVIGARTAEREVCVIESPWDACAAIDRAGWFLPGGGCSRHIVITRGARNLGLVGTHIQEGDKVFLFPQNDPPKADGKPSASESWTRKLVQICSERGAPAFLVRTPTDYKDLNEWTKDGASDHDIEAAIAEAETIWAAAASTMPNLDSMEDYLAEAEESEPFPTEALGPVLADMVREVARVDGVPEAMPGATVLAVVAGCLGKGVRAAILPNKLTFPNLYMLVIARSGIGKTEVCRRCTLPLRTHEAELRMNWNRNEAPQIRAKRRFLEKKMEVLAKAYKPTAPGHAGEETSMVSVERELVLLDEKDKPPKIIVEDVTTPKLAMLLQDHREQLLSLSGDAGDVINNLLGRNQRLNCTDESLYLKAYSCEAVDVDRVSRQSISLREPCLTCLWFGQPDKLATLMSNPKLVHGGLMPRMLMFDANATPTEISSDTPAFDPAVGAAYGQLLTELLLTFRAGLNPVEITVEALARGSMVAFHNEINNRRASDAAANDEFAARHCENACRMALCLHAARHGAQAAAVELSVQTVEDAIRLMKWFIARQAEILPVSMPGSPGDMEQTVLMHLAKKPEGMTGRELVRKRIVPNADVSYRTLFCLVGKGLAVGEERKTGGRPGIYYKAVLPRGSVTSVTP